MTIDKSWTTLANRNCAEFFNGFDAFLERCKDHLNSSKTCRCPCENCDNHVYAPLSTLRVHRYGFSESYTTWRFHGEKFVLPAAHADLGQTTDKLHDYLNDVCQGNTANEHNTDTDEPTEGSSNTSRSNAPSRPTERLYTTLAEVDAVYASQLSQLRAQHSKLQEQLRALQMQTNALYEALRQASINVNLPSSSQPFPSTNLVNDEEVLTTSQMKDKIEENGSIPIPRNMLTSVDGGSTTDSIIDKAPIVGNTDLTSKVTAEPPQKKCAFQMSAPEDSFEIDDDIHDNGHVSFPSAEISKPEASLVANKPAFDSSSIFGNGSVAASSEGKSGNSTSESTTTSIFGSTCQAPQQSSVFGSTFTSSSSWPVFSFVASSTPIFGSSNTTSSFMTAGSTNSSFAGPSVFGNSAPVFGASPNNNNNNNDHMSMEDSMAKDSMQTSSHVSSSGQPVIAPGFMFGSSTLTPTSSPTPATVPFQFGGQLNQNPAQPQNPFQSSSLEFNAGGGSFSLGSGGEKSGRRLVTVVKNENRRK